MEVTAPESRAREVPGDKLLLQIRSDRRLGHEWDDWDGEPLPEDGIFDAKESFFFALAALLGVGGVAVGLGAIWLIGPRLESIASRAEALLVGLVVAGGVAWLLWLVAIAVVLRTKRNWLPPRLAERGLMPRVMPALERLAAALGWSRDRAGNAMLRVYNRLAIARAKPAVAPEEMLILLPRCLGKEAMQDAMGVSARYGVPVFVASRGRYARQMIGMRRPKAVVAIACERDLVSGVHDVAGKLPVLGATLQLGEGPCRNTSFRSAELEGQVRTLLGLESVQAQ